ncbi:MAG: NosD domain-containing protein [Bacillota bacterium]
MQRKEPLFKGEGQNEKDHAFSSAGGIYVDGGQNIEVYDNFVYNCDIGIEVATEHSPDENQFFKVSGIDVHDNVIADCNGWCGLCFGGYDSDRGFTEECEFRNNTLIDNSTQIVVQRSKDNRVYNNLLVGGETDIEFSSDCTEEDMTNDFNNNEWLSEDEALDGLKSLVEGVGSSFVPDEQEIDLWRK